MKTDLICVQPKQVDFPLFRYWLDVNKAKFNDIYIVLSQHYMSQDYTEFFIDNLNYENIHCYDSIQVKAGEDWRSVAVNYALKQSNADSILFVEQDFLIHNETMLDSILDNPNLVGFKEQKDKFNTTYDFDRLHPAFLLAPKRALEETSLDFGVNPFFYDHFGKVTREMFSNQVPCLLLEDLGFNKNKDWEHLAGATLCYNLFLLNQTPKTYVAANLPRFLRYSIDALNCPIIQHPHFTQFLNSFITYASERVTHENIL